MSQWWTELRAAIARLNSLLRVLSDLERQVRALEQRLRELNGG